MNFNVKINKVINIVQDYQSNKEVVIFDKSYSKTINKNEIETILSHRDYNELIDYGSICVNGYLYKIIEPTQTIHLKNGGCILPEDYEGVDG